MGWCSHPDTLTCAMAQGRADRSGHKEGSIEWMKAYRTSYEVVANGEYPESLKEYLYDLDLLIAKKEDSVI